MKNILHISTDDFGGAGIAAYKFHKTLESAGFNSRMLVMEKKTEDSSVIKVKKNEISFKISSKRRNIEDKYGIFNSKYYFYDRMRYIIRSEKDLEKYIEFKPDVIVLSWITYFVDLKVIKKIQKKYNCKIFWYVMDMAPMTGGCHIIWECKEYKYGCVNCPAVKFPYNKLPKRNFKNKEKFLQKIGIEMLYTVPWVEMLLKESYLYKDMKSHFMPVSFDEKLFNTLNKENIRKKYTIPSNKKVILYGAHSISDPRKGYKYFIDSMKYLQKNFEIENILIVLIGQGELDFKSEGINIETKNFGFIKTQERLSEMYKISNLFLSPILSDIGPSMIIESMLCGVPVVSFNRGVSQDIIKHIESGYIAEYKNSKNIAEGINYILNLDEKNYEKLCMKAEESALKYYSKEKYQMQLEEFIKEIEDKK